MEYTITVGLILQSIMVGVGILFIVFRKKIIQQGNEIVGE